MGAKETILTAEGLRKLEDELENLRSVKRQEVAELYRRAYYRAGADDQHGYAH